MLNYIFGERDAEPNPIAYNLAEALATFDAYKIKKNMIVGSTNAADELKRGLDIELTNILNEIGARDANTEYFVEYILIPMIDRKYDPAPQQFIPQSGGE